MSECFEKKISQEYLYHFISTQYLQYFYKKRLLTSLYKKIKPKVIVEVVSYEINRFVTNEVASELGIKTIELQHGVMGRGHVAYNFSEGTKIGSYYPDCLFLFGDYWKEVTRLPIDKKKLCSVGYPYQERTFQEFCKEPNQNGKIILTVLSQPFFYSELIRNSIVELVQNFEDSNINYEIYYKLHPTEFPTIEDNKWAVLKNNKNIHLVSNEENLYYYFSKSAIQVGATSTAIFEGLAYELDTFVIELGNTEDYMGDLIKKGNAAVFKDGKDLFEKIINSRIKQPIHPTEYFEVDSKEKIIKEINTYLKSSKNR
jgi:hypothetical protein